jgi:hypothetical protein
MSERRLFEKVFWIIKFQFRCVSFAVHSTMPSVTRYMTVNNKLEIKWKEVVVAYFFKVLSKFFLEGLKRTMKNLSQDSRCRGRAIAQAVSRWLPTAAVRGSRPGRHVGFCGGQSGAVAGFIRVLRSPLPNSFHQLRQKNYHHHQSVIGDMYNRPNGQTSIAAVQGPNRHLGTWNKDT